MTTRKIGEILLEKGAIRPIQLEAALEIQKNDNSFLGKILIGENYVRNLDLHKAIAERYGLPFVDLTNDPPDYTLLNSEQCHEYFELELIPYDIAHNSVTIATPNISQQVKDWVVENYAYMEVKFVITSPYDIRHVLQQRFADKHDADARLQLWYTAPLYSARKLFHNFRPGILSILMLATITAALMSETGYLAFVIIINSLFFAAVSFKNITFIKGWKHIPDNDVKLTRFPVYTILLPLYHETATLPKLISSIEKLDYPKSKLDVKFVVEADDIITIEAIKRQQPPQYMEIIQVPYSLPRTKPKACNYALNFARGEFVTIYDAEDQPDPQQLKKVLARFQSSPGNLACVQARLNYFNYNDNQLTRWFALEYAIWFDSVMNGLHKMKMPIPLGGTSNHVKTSVLKRVGGWDAFNVTEDADLGMRLAQEGYRTEVVDSLTMEEAPNMLGSWVKQRTRWIKGFMQTYIVHMRDVTKLYKSIGLGGFLSFQFFIGLPAMLYIVAPILLTATLILCTGSNPVIYFPPWLNTLCWMNIFYGIASHMVMSLAAASKAMTAKGEKLFKSDMIFSSLTFYLYGIFHMLAAYRALWQLVAKPHYWDKTQHGLAKTGA